MSECALAPSPRVVLATASDRAAVEELVAATGTALDVDAELERPMARLWLGFAPEDARPAGLLLAWHAADEVHVLDVATRPERRRRGVARALVERALAAGRAGGSRLALLEVRTSNRAARSLYESVGFAADRLRRGYYADGEDAVEMTLVLDERKSPPSLEP